MSGGGNMFVFGGFKFFMCHFKCAFTLQKYDVICDQGS